MMTEVDRVMIATFNAAREAVDQGVINANDRQKVLDLLTKAEEIAMASADKSHREIFGGPIWG